METCFTVIVFQVLLKICIFLVDESFLLGFEETSWSVVRKKGHLLLKEVIREQSLMSVPQFKDGVVFKNSVVTGSYVWAQGDMQGVLPTFFLPNHFYLKSSSTWWRKNGKEMCMLLQKSFDSITWGLLEQECYRN